MLLYLLKTTFCLVLFLGFYHLVLEKEKMHRFNRFYLLGSIVFAFLVPSFTITVSPTEFIEPIVQEYQMVYQMQTTSIASIEETEINYINYVYGLYLLTSGILLFYFVKNLHKILLKTRKNEKVNYYTATVILLKEKILPHTFLKYIFINKNEYINDKTEQLILTHELAHVKQKHSLDVLFIELLQIAFWFIPIFRFYKKAIQLNHEFLADDAVIKAHKNISEYQHLLLNVSTQENKIYLASNLNYSLTKKRLLMMTTPSSKTNILLKKLLVLPLTAGFIFAFAQRVEAKEKKNDPQVIEVITEKNGISDKEMNEYKELITKARRSKIFIYKQLTRMKELYRKMSTKQQNSVEDVFKLAPPLPRITYKKKTPTVTQFNSWKNKENFALWIDGKVVKNTVLNNYKNTDFSYFSGSFVYKNARSKRFPQEYQFNLYTHSSFKKMKEKEALENKNTITIFINKEGGLLVNGKATTIHKLKDVLNKVDIDKTNALVIINGDMGIKMGDITDIREILRESKLYKISFNNKLFPPPPPKPQIKEVKQEKEISEKEMKEYKALFNASEKTKIYKVKDINKLVSLYKKMSKKQQNSITDIRKVVPPPPPKKSQEKVTIHKNWFITIDGQKYHYTFDKNERIARYYKNGKLVNLDIIKEYNKKHKTFERLKNTGKHYVFKSEKDKKEIEREFSDLGGMYFRMPRIDKNKVPFPKNPHEEYVKLERKDGSHYYKKRSELNSEDKKLLSTKFPPPPPPLKKNATKKEIERHNKATKLWKEMVEKLPPPPPPRKQ